jgi:hypothetical protein
MSGASIIFLGEREYAYRRHDLSYTVVNTANMVRFTELAAFYNMMELRTRDLGWSEAARDAAAKRIVKLNLLYCTLKDMIHLRWGQAARKTRFLARLY